MNRRIDLLEVRSVRKRVVGLFGGSFDPAHAGHLHICSYARKRLGLRQIWFLPTQSHPLKSGSRDFASRLASLRALLQGKESFYRVCMAELGRPHIYSWQSIEFLQRRYRGVRFIWLMGADCWDEMLRWQRWQHIFKLLPIVIFSRDPIPLRAVNNRVGVVMSRHRVGAWRGRVLHKRKLGWVYFPMVRHFLSSSLLRGLDG